jgi:hypothetical protein
MPLDHDPASLPDPALPVPAARDACTEDASARTSLERERARLEEGQSQSGARAPEENEGRSSPSTLRGLERLVPHIHTNQKSGECEDRNSCWEIARYRWHVRWLRVSHIYIYIYIYI